MQRRRRLVFTLLTPVLQIVLAVALAVLWASMAEDDLSGWGDLIGVLVGLVLGPGLGLAIMLGVVSRAVGHSLIGSTLRALIALPTSLVISTFAALLDVDFWTALAAYIVGSCALVWWSSGRRNSS